MTGLRTVRVLFKLSLCLATMAMFSLSSEAQGQLTFLPSSSNTQWAYCTDEGGNVVPYCDVVLANGNYEISAGHNHFDSSQPASTLNPYSGNTGCCGLQVQVTTTYVAQNEWINVCADYCNTTNVMVTYGDLYAYLPANSSYVTFVGATTAHPSNHFGTTALTPGVDGVASTWYATYASPVLVNDMGLPWGGWFDLNQNWSCPHQYHGRGTAVDFNGAGPGSAQAQNLQNWCPQNGLTRTYSEPTNFHCEAPDNINRFSYGLCPTSPGATPPNGLSSPQ